MNERTKAGLEILQAAVLLGILGDVLLRQTPWGLNVLLFVGASVAAFVMLVLRRRRENWNAQTIALNAALLFFAAMFVWRDSAELKIFDALAILTILAILTLPILNIIPQFAGVSHYIAGACWSGISALFMPFLLLFDDIKWAQIPQTGWSKHLVSVLRGLAIATPILLVFGALFVAADAVFEGLIFNTLSLDGEAFVGHIIFIGVFTWFTAGYLRGSLIEYASQAAPNIPKQNEAVKTQNLRITKISADDEPIEIEKPKEEEKKGWNWHNFDNSGLPKALTLGAIEISIVLGLVNMLFLAFVIVQIPYLFGGMDLVQNTPDFKLADYARRGFGELVTVAALVLPILLVSHWLVRKDSPINEKIYRVLAGIQIVLLFVIMLSAAQRLFLLTGNLGYGLTTVRFYPMAFMILLALVFVWFGLTVLRGARQQFAWGALWLVLFMLGTLHVFNPDDYITRTNVRLFQDGRILDAHYVTQLSDDAVPAMLENLPLMSFEHQCTVKYHLANRWNEAQNETDFRSWNWSRWSARWALSENAQNFGAENCPDYMQYRNDYRDF